MKQQDPMLGIVFIVLIIIHCIIAQLIPETKEPEVTANHEKKAVDQQGNMGL